MKRFALLLVCLALVVSGTGCCWWGSPCCGGGYGYGTQYGSGCSPCQGGCGYGAGYSPTYSPYGTPTTYYGGGQIAAYPAYPTVTAGVPLQAVPQ
jgi:hypothetical protein